MLNQDLGDWRLMAILPSLGAMRLGTARTLRRACVLRGVHFIGMSTGWAVGDGGVLLRTFDGEFSTLTWTVQTAFTANNLRDVFFINPSTGFVAGQGGVIVKSMDAGASWTSGISSNTNFNGIHFVSTDTGRAVGDAGIIVKSTDSGVSFFSEVSSAPNNLSKIFLLDSDLAYAVGASGTILKNTTGTLPSPASLLPSQGSLSAVNNLCDPSTGESPTLAYATLKPGRISLRIFDARGLIGRSTQSLAIRPRE